MARKKSKSALPEIELPPAAYAGGDDLDEAFAAVFEQGRAVWGDNLYLFGTEESRYFYLPIPLALSLLLQTEGFPMGRFCMLVGTPGSCKSAFSYEMARLHHFNGGGHIYIETEKKDSPILMHSTVGYGSKRMSYVSVDSMEEWMRSTKLSIDYIKQVLDRSKPPRATPWAVIIDSIAGTLTEAQAEKIDSEGASSLSQPIGANLLNMYTKQFTRWFGNYPISVFGINHLKRAKDQYGHNSIRNLQGGYAPRFSETLEIELSTVGKQFKRIEPVAESGNRVSLSIYKQALGTMGPSIEVEMVWYFEDNPHEPGKLRQRTFWDWYTAIIEYLTDPKLSATQRRAVGEVIDLQASRSNKTVWSEALGIPEHSPVGFRQAGLLLENRSDLKEKLYAPLGIRRCLMFQPGEDFFLQKERAAAVIKQRHLQEGHVSTGEPRTE